jgi:hypothetical protein
MPSRRAIEERTWSLSSFSPSISLDFMTSSVRVWSTAALRSEKPRPSRAPDQPALPML